MERRRCARGGEGAEEGEVEGLVEGDGGGREVEVEWVEVVEGASGGGEVGVGSGGMREVGVEGG